MDAIEKAAGRAVAEAGKILAGSEPDESAFKMKGAANYVTDIDYRVQEFLSKRLRELLPGSNIITEESSGNIYKFEKPTWILDPVDGTTNLIKRLRFSCISLGLFIDGKPILSYIYNPFSNELFTARAGRGAHLNGKAIRVSGSADLKDCLIGFGTTPYEREHASKTFAIAERVFRSCLEIRRSGSAALDIAYVACGRFDGFFELKLQPWDFAAGILILQEAGGKITDWSGRELSVLKPDSIVATNGHIHRSLSDMLT